MQETQTTASTSSGRMVLFSRAPDHGLAGTEKVALLGESAKTEMVIGVRKPGGGINSIAQQAKYMNGIRLF